MHVFGGVILGMLSIAEKRKRSTDHKVKHRDEAYCLPPGSCRLMQAPESGSCTTGFRPFSFFIYRSN